MIGSLITRLLLLIFGYAYPAYECYKTVEQNKPDISRLQFWCQYWILVAGLTVIERIGDMFIGWVPMYDEVKLAFIIYLWAPKTEGTTYVYNSFFRPYLAKHENEMDRNLLKLRTRVGDMTILYYQKAATYGETRVYDILHYIASQSTHHQPLEEQLSCTSNASTKEEDQQELEAVPANGKVMVLHETRTPTPSTLGSRETFRSSEGQAVRIDSISLATHEITQSR